MNLFVIPAVLQLAKTPIAAAECSAVYFFTLGRCFTDRNIWSVSATGD